jgi:RNA polymerase sigma-70 factor (ECF subfamily)
MLINWLPPAPPATPSRDARQSEALRLAEQDEPEEVGPVADDELRLIFTCCHPALARSSLVALTLRLIAGLPSAA